MNEKERRAKYYQENKEKVKVRNSTWIENNEERMRELKKRWRDENKDKIKVINKLSRAKLKLRTPLEKRQKKNREGSKKWRETSGGKWQAYARDYMKEYYAKNPINKIAHTIRTHAKSLFNNHLKTNSFPARNGNQKVPYVVESVRNILEVYSIADEHNTINPKSYCVHHIISIPWLLRFFKVNKVSDLNVKIWSIIWDICNLGVCEIKENSRKRNFINADVLATAEILEEKHKAAKGLRAFLVSQI